MENLRRLHFFAILLFLSNALSAQFTTGKDTLRIQDSLGVEEYWIYPDDPFLANIDKEIRLLFITEGSYSDSVDEKQYSLPKDSIPPLDFEAIRRKLAILDQQTPLELQYNKVTARMIEFYLEDRRGMIGRVLGLAQLYYPLFESELEKEGLPIELKHLAVVESALINVNRSHMGAVGLWQFMYNTARYLGMQIDTYVDERRDPIASTKTAVKYLKYLHSLYDDWYMALAAYNAGPGNVNKAIRRAGGKKSFWDIYQYLPAETRSYVPAFIAVNYVMNYPVDHNIRPVQPGYRFSEIDTVQVNAAVHFEQISKVLCIPEAELSFLNPQYKENYIPLYKSPKLKYKLVLPYYLVGDFVLNEKAIYNYKEPFTIDSILQDTFEIKGIVSHTVEIGETLGSIAEKYQITVNDIKANNQIEGNVIKPKQVLLIAGGRKVVLNYFFDADSSKYIIHQVKKGEKLKEIIQSYTFSNEEQVMLDNNLDLTSDLSAIKEIYIKVMEE